MKLIFLDIDGALTVPGENVPPQSALEAIRAAQGAGYQSLSVHGAGTGPKLMTLGKRGQAV